MKEGYSRVDLGTDGKIYQGRCEFVARDHKLDTNDRKKNLGTD